MKISCSSARGQALILTTLSLTFVFGMVGLAVDLGWGYYLHKVNQASADAAALAAASKALEDNGQRTTPQCGSFAQCQALTACPASGNLQTGCLYAQQNGIAQGGANGHQSMQMSAGATSTAPNVPNVPGLAYWVQAVATHQSPQLFSVLLGKNLLGVSARATAALYPISISPSVFLLNRSGDCFVSALTLGLVCGEDLLTAVSARLIARGGINMSSSNGTFGLGLPNVAAATIVGNAQVTAPFTNIMGGGGVAALGSADWTAAPRNGFPDGERFRDPMRGKGQPGPPSGLPDVPVPGGLITGSLLGAPRQLPPGNYYATLPLTGQPSGLPITIAGAVSFTDGAANPCNGFCEYAFFGGLVTASLSTVTFSPGRYVFAGATPVAGAPGIGLMVGANSTVRDLTPMVNGSITANTDAGEIFIFTDDHYPGLNVPSAIRNSGISFPQVIAGVQGGVGYTAVLHGLNPDNAAVPADLKRFAPTLFWQDQANTTLKYKDDGSLDVSCGGICENILSVPGSQQMVLEATQSGGRAGVNFYGTIYTPRGSYILVLGLLPNDAIAGPLQIITGALEMALNSKLDLTPLPKPMTRLTVSLIE